MIIEQGTEIGNRTILKNGDGEILSGCISFNTETKEAEMYAFIFVSTKTGCIEKQAYLDNQKRRATFKCVLSDFRAYDKKTGEEIE